MGVNGFLALHLLKGTTSGINIIEFFVINVLPIIPTNSVVVMDNASIHKGVIQEA